MSLSAAAVVLLVMVTYSTALLGPAGPWAGSGAGDPSLGEVETLLREGILRTLDEALPRAVQVAVLHEGVDLGGALDAAFAACLPRRLPAVARGWEVDLVGATAGLTGSPFSPYEGTVPAGANGPVARVEVVLRSPPMGDAPAVRMVLEVEGDRKSPDVLVTRTAAIARGLSDDGGALAYVIRNLLWGAAQEEVLDGGFCTGEVLGPEGVKETLSRALMSISRGGLPAAPRTPVLDLEALVRQSLEGALHRNLGWVDEYILGVEGLDALDGLEDELARLAARKVTELTLAVLDALGGDGWDRVSSTGLRDMVGEGVDALTGLSGRLQDVSAFEGMATRVGREFAREAVGWVPEALHGPLVDALARTLGSRAAWAFAQVALVAARLGLDCARDALLAIGMCGREVDVDGAGMPGAGGPSPRVELGPLDVTTAWTGEVTCDPGHMIGPALRALLEGEGPRAAALGTMPYRAVCQVVVTGTARLTADLQGSRSSAEAGGRGVSWQVPVDLALEVPLASGRPLEGVEYSPSATLAGDLSRVVEAAYGSVGSSIGWLVRGFTDADEWVRSQLSDLAASMRESLMSESAYTLSQALWSIGDDLVDRRVNDAINGSWDLLMDLFGEDLREALTWEVPFLGTDLTLSVDPARQQLEVLATRGDVSLQLCVRRLCDPHPPFAARPVSGYHWGVFGEAWLDQEGSGAVLHLDPLTLEHPSVLTLEARWGDVMNGTGRVLSLDALEARKEPGSTGVSLSQLVGGSALLSMAGGLAVDAGLVVRGDLGEEGAMGEMLTRAVKDAWMATVRGWSVGDLLGETGEGPDASAFVETLLRELYFALQERGSELVEEVEAFIEVDPPDPVWPAVRVSLVVVRPLEALLPLVDWVGGALPALVEGAWSGGLGGRHGGRTGLTAWVAEHVVVRVDLSWTVEPPARLRSLAGDDVPDRVGLVFRCQANLASLAALAGRGPGRWEVSSEVLLRGLPGVVLAVVPGMGDPGWRWAEVTLVRMRLRETGSPMVLLSQVLYDARGTDADLEFVELFNGDDRVWDLQGWCVEDDGGRLVVKGHHPLLPGDHLLLARNGSAVRDAWGQRADVDGMRLRLSNDGDTIMLLGPDGSLLDMVAWEGHVPGWEGIEAGEGLALVRLAGSLPRCEPSAWTVEVPAPRGSAW